MKILRFGLTSRALHWSHAVFFIWLMITGFYLFLTTESLLGNPLIRIIHLYASLPFILLPWLIYVLGSRHAHADVKELTTWKWKDLRWFIGFLKNRAVASGKFNGGQKFNFLFSLFLITGLSFSGFVVWMKSRFGVDFVELNFAIHDFFAVLSVLLLFVHVIFSFYYSESLRGIIFGKVNEDWVKKHYPCWLTQEFES